MTRGQLISIEGIEGAGKSTALMLIKNYLAKLKVDAVWTREPGGTELAEQIREMVLHPTCKEEITPEAELLLMFAARTQHIQSVILPALNAGKWVVTDRYIDASYAYQGGGRYLNEEFIAQLDKWVVSTEQPNLTLLLDVSPELGFQRADKRGRAQDRIEQEKMEFFSRVRDAYLERAQKDSQRIKVIDASADLFAVESQIKHVLDKFMVRVK
jgi:dTMP kinase